MVRSAAKVTRHGQGRVLAIVLFVSNLAAVVAFETHSSIEVPIRCTRVIKLVFDPPRAVDDPNIAAATVHSVQLRHNLRDIGA